MIATIQLSKTLQRFQSRELERSRNVKLIKERRFLEADSPDRVEKFLSRRQFSPSEVKAVISAEHQFGLESALAVPKKTEVKILERIIGTNDLLDISFITRAALVARTVGRIWIFNSSGKVVSYGTGFMISPSLMITNNHVLPQSDVAALAKLEMNYEFDTNQVLRTTDLYDLDPKAFFITDEEMDYSVTAVAPLSAANRPLSEYGFNPLIKDEGKTIISQWLNIIEHPNGMPKQIGIRENQLIDILDNFLHYKTDTAPGASGSPVYNENWEVVGLHHSGVYEKDANGNILATSGAVWKNSMGEDAIRWTMNEGVRISSILKHISSQRLSGRQAELLEELNSAKLNVNSNPNANLNLNPTPTMASNSENRTMGNSAQVNSDGSVSIQVPLTINLRLGDGRGLQISADAQGSIASASPSNEASEKFILEKAKAEFLKRGDVINVRWGYVFKNGWITKDRALVATVPERKTLFQLTKEGTSPLPKLFMGYPVEVTGPTLKELLGLTKVSPAKESMVIQDGPSVLEYTPPPNGKLKKVTATMKVTASVSPEEGWNTLKDHLSKTKKRLTVGMYDFGATHVADEIEKVAKRTTFKGMTMAIQVGSDAGSGTKADDLDDDEMVDRLKKKLGKKFSNAWVRVGRKNGWVPSSYHIKVAVRDGEAISLSSGNWQSSNIPNLENLDNTKQTYLLNNYNREWHIVLENKEIAEAYETFILNDYENNKHNTLSGTDEAFDQELYLMLPDLASPAALEVTKNVKTFEPFEQNRKFTVTPLLSPDNYFDEVLEVIRSAKRELFIQNQTFNAPGENHDKLQRFIDAVLEKKKQGVDVRIIFRNYRPADARENLEKLLDMDFDVNQIKAHNKCHTKGIIVDEEKVIIGSQNWSNDGISVNRDASLYFEDAPLAKYFREIFLHDWTNVANYNIGPEKISMRTASASESAPSGMVKIGWADIQETL